MALKTISYSYHDPDNTLPYWQGYTEIFDDTVISVADKIAEEYDKRTAGKTAEGRLKAERYFFDDSLMIIDNAGGGGDGNGIYSGSGLVPSATVSTLTDSISFIGGNLAIGTTIPDARITARSETNDASSNIAKFENFSGQDKYLVNGSGQSASYSGVGTASIQGAFGSFNQASGFPFGHGFYGESGVTTALLGVNRGNLTANPFGADFQVVGNKVGTATAIRGFTLSSGQSTAVGVQGIARNGTANNWGVYGNVAGGWNASVVANPPNDVRGVNGVASANLNTINYGGYFSGSNDNNSNITEDCIGVLAIGSANSVASGSTGKSVGGVFRALTSGAGTNNRNVALNVPVFNSALNDGNVVFGAPESSIFRSMLEVTGDIELINIGNGIIMKSPNGTRYRITVKNNGGFESALA
jgi:hypothetical protein